jgi:hypothetical protein
LGFFDELDKVAPPPGAVHGEADDQALVAAIDKLVAGWVWDGVLGEPVPEDKRADAIEQRVRIEHEGGRFRVRQSVVYGRRISMGRPDHHQERSVDRQGLVELVRDQPLVGKRLVEAAGKDR